MNSSLAIESRAASPVPWPMPRAVMFDLDGTLIDSVPDITLSVNELLASEQLPALEEAQVRRMVGHGIPALVRKAYKAQGVALDGASLESRTDAMMDIYPRHLTGRTTLMPGVREMVAFFVAGGARLALVTNKPQAAAHTILGHFGLSDSFSVVIGDADHQLRRKPQPDMLLAALGRLGVEAANAIMVGDSTIDIAAARAAHVRSVVVRCGYADGALDAADAVVADPGAIAALFGA
jgi:phosphoglycolate phosphatase